MVLNTNIYLHLPVSSYDGRRFLVLLEPMLAPSATNARIYANDYIVVASPAGNPLGAVHMDDIRHTYLHYEIEPLVYARAQAMERLQPLLKAVQDAPLDFTYKTEIVPLITECLIKAIETHTMDVGLTKPERPDPQSKQRADLERYDAEMSAYDHQAEAVRRKAVDLAMRQGWVLVDYFYDQLGAMEKERHQPEGQHRPDGLRHGRRPRTPQRPADRLPARGQPRRPAPRHASSPACSSPR